MPLINEYELQNIKKLKTNCEPPYDKLLWFEDDLYFPLDAFGLSRAELVAWFISTGVGTAIYTSADKIYLSSETAIAMLRASKNIDTEEFIRISMRLRSEAKEILEPEIIPINKELL